MSSKQQDIKKMLDSTSSLLAIYDRKEQSFRYHDDLQASFGRIPEGQMLWDFLRVGGILSAKDAEEIRDIVLSLDDKNSVFFKVYSFGVKGRHILSFTYENEKVVILIKLFDQGDLDIETVKYDELTRLISRKHFSKEIERINSDNPDIRYALCLFDIIRFKAINDIFGFDEGDALLKFIADKLRSTIPVICLACRISADRFAFFADITKNAPEDILQKLFAQIKEYKLPLDISFNAGIYLPEKNGESGNSMLNKATLAHVNVKGNYTSPIKFYTDELRDEMLSEQEIVGEMNNALKEEQFAVYYQPQYNHSTGMLVGAEALVRWLHPQKGMIPPVKFIGIFEKNGFITTLDYYVFDKVTRFLRYCMDNNFSIVPISVNFSKNDIFSQGFVEKLESIREKNGVPSKYLRIEITESILIGNNKAVNEILKKLSDCGYVIEMDDFGSGYSSLNALKDLDFDIIKLDMMFLESKGEDNRGGTILASVINMAKWLHIPVIAEGVETVEQADYLKSIGCNYIQGYLYSKPLPQNDYEALVSAGQIGSLMPQMNMIDALNSANFWDPDSQETLIFSNFVGAAAIFNYDRITKKLEMLRINKKYIREIGMNLSEKDIIHMNPSSVFDKENQSIYYETLERAIETGEEQECETWRTIRSDCCGDESMCIRSTVLMIGQSDEHILFYSTIRNITSEKRVFNSMLDTEKRFKMASEQVNIYFWEYTIATKEMRPCFRCMRDLGLPPLLRDYPNSAIEQGIFPPEVADMYRDWHVRLANGEKELEAIIPLTMDRIPFRVRYTTEFDENGNPIKAYGSAALIVE